jgi:hypothetical protein
MAQYSSALLSLEEGFCHCHYQCDGVLRIPHIELAGRREVAWKNNKYIKYLLAGIVRVFGITVGYDGCSSAPW